MDMTDIFFHNTLSGKKEKFIPIIDGEARMYNCGPTVYNRAHIGNLRAYVFADVLRKTLEFNNYQVKQVINITDVGHLTDDGDDGEDKIEKVAKKTKKTAKNIADENTELFLQDLKKLGINTDKIEFPRATNYIGEQIAIIQTLIDKGYVYKTKDGLYFDTSLFEEYGKLGKVNLKGLKEGARIAKNTEKKNPTDFALWKFSPKKSKRQQEWDSPWGVGFPGWHIECSAMSRAILGAQIDIHTGGVEHIPVHHNNEIAQSECASGKEFARFWMHFEHILIDGKKMSKSLGNVYSLDDIISKVSNPLVYRYWLLSGHYRSQMNFTWEALQASYVALEKIYAFTARVREGAEHGEKNEKYINRFIKFINDDLSTPQALALMWEMLKNDTISDEDKYATLLEFDKVFGFKIKDINLQKTNNIEIDIPDNVKELILERQKFREAGDYKHADKIRDKILSSGFEIKDLPDGVDVTPVKE